MQLSCKPKIKKPSKKKRTQFCSAKLTEEFPVLPKQTIENPSFYKKSLSLAKDQSALATGVCESTVFDEKKCHSIVGKIPSQCVQSGFIRAMSLTFDAPISIPCGKTVKKTITKIPSKTWLECSKKLQKIDGFSNVSYDKIIHRDSKHGMIQVLTGVGVLIPKEAKGKTFTVSHFVCNEKNGKIFQCAKKDIKNQKQQTTCQDSTYEAKEKRNDSFFSI